MLADDPPFDADAVHVCRVTHAIGFSASVATAIVISVAVEMPCRGSFGLSLPTRLILWPNPEHGDCRSPIVTFLKWQRAANTPVAVPETSVHEQ